MPSLSRRRARILTASSGLLVAVGVALYATSQFYAHYEGRVFPRPDQLLLLAAVSFVTGVAMFLMAYLQGDYERTGPVDIDELAKRIAEMTVAQQPQTPATTETETRRQIGSVLQQIHAVDSDAGEITEEAGTESTPDEEIKSLLKSARIRLRREIKTLSRRANVNLVIGVAISLAGLGLLVYLVSRQHDPFATIKDVLAHYIPRLTTVILVETLAYFFLQLYKANLAEIKYYQNELTTIYSKDVALRAALLPQGALAIRSIILQLARVDRNLPTVVNSSKSNADLTALVEVLQNVSKLIVKSSKE